MILPISTSKVSGIIGVSYVAHLGSEKNFWRGGGWTQALELSRQALPTTWVPLPALGSEIFDENHFQRPKSSEFMK
jgi:hypothetical protein